MMPYQMTLVYVAFFGLIGFALYLTENIWCLAALIFTPNWSSDSRDRDDNDG